MLLPLVCKEVTNVAHLYEGFKDALVRFMQIQSTFYLPIKVPHWFWKILLTNVHPATTGSSQSKPIKVKNDRSSINLNHPDRPWAGVATDSEGNGASRKNRLIKIETPEKQNQHFWRLQLLDTHRLDKLVSWCNSFLATEWENLHLSHGATQQAIK